MSEFLVCPACLKPIYPVGSLKGLDSRCLCSLPTVTITFTSGGTTTTYKNLSHTFPPVKVPDVIYDAFSDGELDL